MYNYTISLIFALDGGRQSNICIGRCVGSRGILDSCGISHHHWYSNPRMSIE